MGEPATLRDEARGDDRWAGRDFLGLGPVKATEASRWSCLSCPQTGSGSSQAVRYAAEEHARTERHFTEMATNTVFVPEETT